jgi:hypothetical protein
MKENGIDIINASNHPKVIKNILKEKLEEFGGDFDKLLEDMEKYAILPEVEDYENAAIIRDYRRGEGL